METVRRTDWGVILAAAFVFILSICRAADPLFFGGLAAAAVLGWLIHRGQFRLSVVDWAVVGVWGAECLMLVASVNIDRSFVGLRILTQSVFFYFILRIGFRSDCLMRRLLSVGGAAIGAMVWIAIVSFVLFYDSVTHAGFGELYHFRNMYRPLGYLTNAWGSVLIGFLSVTVLLLWYYRHRPEAMAVIFFAIAVPIGFGLVVSFSRGVYLALGLVGMGALVSIWKIRRSGSRVVLMFFVALSLCTVALWPFRADILRTVEMTGTVSQQRSIDGRMLSDSVARRLFRERPMAGIGAGNYSLGVDQYLYQNTDRSFTSFAPGITSQLMVEKGLAGIVVWITFGTVCLVVFLKNKRKSVLIVMITAFLPAIILREGTFPVFFEYSSLQIVVFTLLAVWQNSLPANHSEISQHLCVTLVPAVIGLAIFCFGWSMYSVTNQNARAVAAAAENNLTAAADYLDRTRESIPSLINRSALNWRRYNETGNPKWLRDAERDLRAAIRLSPRDVQLSYRLACVLKASGKGEPARQLIENLAARFPDNAQYNWTLGHVSYRQDNGSRAAQEYLVKAIRLMPDLLESEEWKDLAIADTLLAQSVRQTLMEESKTNAGSNPVKIAKNGKINYLYGDQNHSLSLLSEAVKQLPNLSNPWYYLGTIAFNQGDTVRSKLCFRRAAFLSSRVKPEKNPAGTGFVLDMETPEKRWMRSYQTKFARWYRCQLTEVEYKFNIR